MIFLHFCQADKPSFKTLRAEFKASLAGEGGKFDFQKAKRFWVIGTFVFPPLLYPWYEYIRNKTIKENTSFIQYQGIDG